KAGGKRIQHASGLEDEHIGRLVHSQSAGLLIGHRHQLWKLSLRDPDSVAADLSEHESVKNEVANHARNHVEQDRAAGLASRYDYLRQNIVDGNADYDTDGEIDLFLGVYEQVYIHGAKRVRIRLHVRSRV